MSTVVRENRNVLWDPDSSLGVSYSYCSTEAPVTVPFSQTNHCQIHTRVTVRNRDKPICGSLSSQDKNN